jgi:hypothetical protein
MSGEIQEPVLLAEFGQRVEAEIALSALEAAGIRALVQADDCGAVDPALAFGRGVRLVVSQVDLERAREVLREARESQ